MINDIDSNGNTAGAADNEAKIINLDEVRRKRTSANPVVEMPPQQSKVHARTLPDFAAIAREPDYARRRRQLGEAITAGTGITPGNFHLDSQMIRSGLAAGHGNDDSMFPLGSSTDDPAVVVGLVLHFSRGNRTVPIPSPLNPESIDAALRRSGRLEAHIEIPLPDTDALVGILVHHLGNDFPGVAASQPNPSGSAPEPVPVSDEIFYQEGARA